MHTITAGTVNASANAGITLVGTANAIGTFSASNTNFFGFASNGITLVDNGAVTVNAITQDGAGDVDISTDGTITVAQALDAGTADIVLTSTGGDVTINALVTSTGTFTSSGAAFNFNVSMFTGNITIDHTGLVSLNGGTMSAGGGTGNIDITGAGVTQGSGALAADKLSLQGTGTFSLTSGNQVNTLAADVDGALTFTNFTSFDVGTANGINGIDTNGNPVTLTSTIGNITTSQAITAGAGDVTFTASGGNVTIGSTVTTTGEFISSGVDFTNNTSISANGITLTHSGAVTINNTMNAGSGALSITGATTITDAASDLSGTSVDLGASGAISVAKVTSTSGDITLNSTGGLVTLNGDLLAQAGAADVFLTGSGVTQNNGIIDADTLTLSGTGTFTLNKNNSINTLNATVTGALTFVNANAFDVSSINSGGGAIDLTANAGDITLTGDVNAGIGTVMFHGSVALGANIIVTGSDVTFGGTVDGNKSLEVRATGTTTFSDNVGSGTALTSLITDLPGGTTLNGNITADSVSIGDALTLTADSTITTTIAASFGGTVTGVSNFQVNGGPATFLSPTVTTTGMQTYNAAVSATGTATFMGTAISFNNGISDISDVTITADGSSPVNVSGTSNVGSLTVNGATSTSLFGDLTAANDINVTAGNLLLSGEIESTSGSVLLPGNVSLSNDTQITAGGTNITLGNITGDGPVDLTLITTGTVTGLPFPNGPIITVGSIGASGPRLGDIAFHSAFVVHLRGDITANNVEFAAADGGDYPLANIPLIATVSRVFSGTSDAQLTPNELIIDVTTGFKMFRGQKLSVFDDTVTSPGFAAKPSDVTILSGGSTIQVGDISTTGKITLNAGSGSIVLSARPAAPVLQPGGGTTTDFGTDLVGREIILTTGGNIKLTVDLAGLPANPKPVVQLGVDAAIGFVDINGTHFSGGDLSGADGSVQQALRIALIGAADFPKQGDFKAPGYIVGAPNEADRLVLDFRAKNLGSAVTSTGGIVSPEVEILVQAQLSGLSGALRDALREIGIFARDPNNAELLDFLIGRALYDDLAYKFDPLPEDTTVVSNRLPYSPVIRTVEAYRALFFKEELDENGKPVLDEKGKPKMVAQDSAIKNAFGLAWQHYVSHTPKDQATPDRFRAYLEATEATEPKCAKALGYLNQLRDLLAQIQTLGLTDTEFEVSKKVLLAKVRPANIKEADFYSAITGPSTKTRNVTAMK